MTTPVHVTVTGAAGQIGYSLLFRIASGQLLGPDTPIVLRLLEIEPAMKSLEGVVMELDDCAFPLLAGIEATSDLNLAFTNTNWALLVGSVPRKAGMERGDLLKVNGGIFKPQGEAIAANAASDVRILVVGNPCNTNCLIARSNAPEVPDDRWFAMTRLDQNRAETQLAKKAGVAVKDVKNFAIWGNHSATQFPDFANATITGTRRPTPSATRRGCRESSSRPSRSAAPRSSRRAVSVRPPVAANAAIDTVVSLVTATASDDCASVAVTSHGEYGVPEGLTFGFPVVSDGHGSWKVKEGFVDEFAKDRIKITTDELLSERDEVTPLGLI